MEQEQIELIRSVLSVIGGTGKETIVAYTKWSFVSSLSWFVFGILMVIASVVIFFRFKPVDYYNGRPDVILRWSAISVVAFFGVMAIFINLSGIVAPEAEAVFRLINQVIGRR